MMCQTADQPCEILLIEMSTTCRKLKEITSHLKPSEEILVNIHQLATNLVFLREQLDGILYTPDTLLKRPANIALAAGFGSVDLTTSGLQTQQPLAAKIERAVEAAAYRLEVQLPLRAEEAEQVGLRDAGAARDRIGRRAVQPVLGELLARRLEHRLAALFGGLSGGSRGHLHCK